LEHPEHARTIARVMAIPTKRHDSSLVSYLDPGEITALLAAPDKNTWLGRRDHALLAVMIQTGVRVSELTGLRLGDVHLGAAAHPSPYDCNALAGQGGGHRHDRDMAQPRDDPNHTHLRTCGPGAQGTGHRTNRSARRQTRPISAIRRTARLP